MFWSRGVNRYSRQYLPRFVIQYISECPSLLDHYPRDAPDLPCVVRHGDFRIIIRETNPFSIIDRPVDLYTQSYLWRARTLCRVCNGNPTNRPIRQKSMRDVSFKSIFRYSADRYKYRDLRRPARTKSYRTPGGLWYSPQMIDASRADLIPVPKRNHDANE